MNVKIDDLMVHNVMATSPSQTIGRVKEVMRERGIHSMPVLDPEGRALGIVTTSDMLDGAKDGAKVSQIMTRDVHTVPRYGDPSDAAHLMRKHRIHHVLVTDEKKVVGVLSSFDLLQLIEERRFVAKGAPTKGKKGGGRKKGE
jgi:signal-transduction protein with cAMP-binding, CBS, and nucleotidyltransferase domain